MPNATKYEPNNPVNLPTPDEMLEMLNVDILPFFDTYEPAALAFTKKYRAVAIISETARDIVVTLNAGTTIAISKIYFQFPHSEKTNVIQRLQGTLS